MLGNVFGAGPREKNLFCGMVGLLVGWGKESCPGRSSAGLGTMPRGRVPRGSGASADMPKPKDDWVTGGDARFGEIDWLGDIEDPKKVTRPTSNDRSGNSIFFFPLPDDG